VSALYVYGIVDTEQPAGVAELPAVGGSPTGEVRVVGEPGLPVRAVVSPAPADLRGKRRDLLTHQRVLDALAEQCSVLPMRFGMVAPDEPTLLAGLRAETERYRALLGELAGQVELNLKAVPDEEQFVASAANDPVVRNALAATRRSGSPDLQVQLGRTVAEAVARRRQLCASQLLNQLRPLASRTNALPSGERYVLNAAFLVRRSAVEEFVETVDRLREQLSPAVDLTLTGPLPPYSFVGND
jgi:hypothetical protein